MHKIRTSTIKNIEHHLSDHKKYTPKSSMKVYSYKYAVIHLIRISHQKRAKEKLLDIPFLLNMYRYSEACTYIIHAFNILGNDLIQEWIEKLQSTSINEHQWSTLIDIFHCTSHYSIATVVYKQFQKRNIYLSDPEDRIEFLRSAFILHTTIAKYELMINIGEELLSLLEIHPQFQDDYLLSTQSELALAYKGLSEYDKADEIMTSLWNKRPKDNSGNIDYLGLYMNLANLRNFLGKEQEAVEIYIEIIEILEKQGQTELELYHTTRHNLASCYSDLGQEEKALQMQEDLYRDTLMSKGKYHSDTAMNLYCLARTLYVMDNYSKAELYCKRAFEINKKVFGIEHEQTISSLNLLGHTYFELGKLNKAEQTLLSCKNYGSLIWPDNNINMLSIYDGLYEVFEAKKLYNKAEEVMIAYAEGHKKTHGDESPRLGTTYWRLYKLSKKQGKQMEALDYAKRCMHIELSTEGFSNDTKVTSSKIVDLLLSVKNYDGIMNLFHQIRKRTQTTPLFILFLAETIEKDLSNQSWSKVYIQYLEQETEQYTFSATDLKTVWKIANIFEIMELYEKTAHYRSLCVQCCVNEYGWNNKDTLLTILQCLKDMENAELNEEQNNLVFETIQNLSRFELNENCEVLLDKIRLCCTNKY